ncbi:MAG: AtzH-like domain-containing protein, partial [Gluconobacter cerinus]|uniref:AtzH-like domain-containing protein n=1 Tax=Gluconobacter cerinus TaxID=38307 RepID=UPI0039ED3E6C
PDSRQAGGLGVVYTPLVELDLHRRGGSKIGRQSQTWFRTQNGWKILAAHVSLMADIS